MCALLLRLHDESQTLMQAKYFALVCFKAFSGDCLLDSILMLTVHTFS